MVLIFLIRSVSAPSKLTADADNKTVFCAGTRDGSFGFIGRHKSHRCNTHIPTIVLPRLLMKIAIVTRNNDVSNAYLMCIFTVTPFHNKLLVRAECLQLKRCLLFELINAKNQHSCLDTRVVVTHIYKYTLCSHRYKV